MVIARSDMRVATRDASLAPDEQRQLRVDLQIGLPEDDVDARTLEHARRLDVSAFVESSVELDDADGVLVFLSGLDSDLSVGDALSRPVDRRLERSDTRVACGRDERADARLERVVRMVCKGIASADPRQQRRRAPSRERTADDGAPTRLSQIRPLESPELSEVAEADGSGALVDVTLGDGELAHRGGGRAPPARLRSPRGGRRLRSGVP